MHDASHLRESATIRNALTSEFFNLQKSNATMTFANSLTVNFENAGRTQGGINRFISQKLPKLDLATDEEYFANLVNQYTVVNLQNCNLLHAQRHLS